MIPQSNFWMICRNNNPQLTPPTNKICKALPLNRRGFFTFWGDTWGLSYAPHGHTQAPYSATLLNMLGLPPNQPIELVRALYDTRRNGFRCGISRGRWMLPVDVADRMLQVDVADRMLPHIGAGIYACGRHPLQPTTCAKRRGLQDLQPITYAIPLQTPTDFTYIHTNQGFPCRGLISNRLQALNIRHQSHINKGFAVCRRGHQCHPHPHRYRIQTVPIFMKYQL